MLFKTFVTSTFLMGILLAACQPAPNIQSLPDTKSPVPTGTKTPIPTTEKLVLTEISPEPKADNIEPTQLPSPTEVMIIESVEDTSKETKALNISVEGLDYAGTINFPQDQSGPWPGVILIHMLYGDQSQWEMFPLQLAEAGFAVLSIDLRGHGETGGEVDWELVTADLQQVWSFFSTLEEVDADRTAFIGASIGANLALIASSNETSVKTAVLLSPGLNYAGIETETAINTYGERPVLIIASQEDTYAANSSVVLDATAKGESQLIMYQDAGHGTFMLRGEPELLNIIIKWLNLHLQ